MIRLTKHAREAMLARSILQDWIRLTILSPERVEADPRHPERTRSYKPIEAFGGRILRVVHRMEGKDIIVVTVHFDRGARR